MRSRDVFTRKSRGDRRESPGVPHVAMPGDMRSRSRIEAAAMMASKSHIAGRDADFSCLRSAAAATGNNNSRAAFITTTTAERGMPSMPNISYATGIFNSLFTYEVTGDATRMDGGERTRKARQCAVSARMSRRRSHH